MKGKRTLTITFVLVLLMTLAAGIGQAQGPEGGISAQAEMGYGFTYQGYLTDGAGTEITDTCDFVFGLYATETGGTEIQGRSKTGISVQDGYFVIPDLNFTSGDFNGDARWLETAVSCTGDGLVFTTISPRQELRPVPYALALPGLWTIQNTTSPSVIGGYAGNSVTTPAWGATIGGGGSSVTPNRITDHYGTVGGGLGNRAGDNAGTVGDANYATVGGGAGNVAGDEYATVAGGVDNTAEATKATVGGGIYNDATGESSTVAGGDTNTAGSTQATVGGGGYNQATGQASTIPGGEYNLAQGNYSFAAGRRAKANHDGAFVWADSTDADFGSTGSDQFLVRASGGVRMVVSGGYFAVQLPTSGAVPDIIAGHSDNWIAAGVEGATIGGGGLPTTNANRVTDNWGTVGGGANNQAGNNAGNQMDANYATVAGGVTNKATEDGATVSGGASNTASGNYAMIPGGYLCTAGGSYSFAAGYNSAANQHYSFALGRQAVAQHQGAFVWGDSTASPVFSSGANQFIVRASGGVTMYTNSGLSSGVTLQPGSGSWSSLSDRAAKANLATVDGYEVLALLAEIPISTWNYEAQNAGIRHMGPMAQDFYAAFGLGESERYISSIDADGVALAAIQGLYGMVLERDTVIEELASENAALERRLDDLEARLAALETGNTPKASPFQMGLLPGAGVLVLGLGLVWLNRRGDGFGLRGGRR